LTGNGLKDPDTAVANSINPFQQGIPANIEAVAAAMGF
jgi:threonine synthase